MFPLYIGSPLWTFVLIFYTCVLIPLFKITQPVQKFFSYMYNPHQLPQDSAADFLDSTSFDIDLPVLKFQELAEEDEDEEEVCSICLMEFEKEDLVNKLPRCRHMFHKECMEKWLDRYQFTCPLCRSMLFTVSVSSSSSSSSSSSPCNLWASPFCVLPQAHD